MADLKYLRRKRLYTVIAHYTYEDGKQHYPKENGKMYPEARYVLGFMKDEIKKAREHRERRVKFSSYIHPVPYTVTFKVYETPLDWKETTAEWEDELTLMALGGET